MSTTKNATRQFPIEAGPSKDTIFDACKYAYEKSSKVSVHFGIAAAYTQPPESKTAMYVPMEISNLRINGVSHEDGSGSSLLIEGYCTAESDYANIPEGSYRFKALYNAKTRKGHFTLL